MPVKIWSGNWVSRFTLNDNFSNFNTFFWHFCPKYLLYNYKTYIFRMLRIYWLIWYIFCTDLFWILKTLYLVQMSKWLSFCRKSLLLCRLKTLISLKIMIIQLFARYRKLITYMSDMLIYVFFLIWKPWKMYPLLGRCSLYFGWVLDTATMLYIDVYLYLSIYPT